MLEQSNNNDYLQILTLGELIHKDFKKLYPIESLYNDYTKIITYKEKNEIIGFIQYEILYETVNIINIVVKEEYRKNNIASILIDYLLSDICNKNINNILLEVRSDNVPALNLYTKFNFEVINIRKKYYQDVDGIVMERRIK